MSQAHLPGPSPNEASPGARQVTSSQRHTTPVLQVRGISRHFGPVHALRDVDFAVCLSEVVALIGDNGAGKSTLIDDLAGVIPFGEGEYSFNGKSSGSHLLIKHAPMGSRPSTRV